MTKRKRNTDRQTDRQTDTDTDRHRHTDTHRHTHEHLHTESERCVRRYGVGGSVVDAITASAPNIEPGVLATPKPTHEYAAAKSAVSEIRPAASCSL